MDVQNRDTKNDRIKKAKKLRKAQRKIEKKVKRRKQEAGILPNSGHLDKRLKNRDARLALIFLDQPVYIFAYESSVLIDKFVLSILFMVKGKSYLVDICFSDSCNYSTLALAILENILKYGIHDNLVLGFSFDNAAYCKEAYHSVLKKAFPNSRLLCRFDRIFNLIGDCWENHESIQPLKEFLVNINNYLKKIGSRIRRFKKFMEEKCLWIKQDGMYLPRWSSWYHSSLYHLKRIDVYPEFFKMETELCDTEFSDSIAVSKMLNDEKTYLQIKILLVFVADSANTVYSLIRRVQSKSASAHLAIGYLDKMRVTLEFNSERASYSHIINDLMKEMDCSEKQFMTSNFNAIAKNALDILYSHMEELPAKELFDAIRIFDPCQAPDMERSIEAYKVLPMHSSIHEEEWNIYMNIVRSENDLSHHSHLEQDFDLTAYWNCLSARVPTVAKVALVVLFTPLTSCDVEQYLNPYKDSINKESSSSEQLVRVFTKLKLNYDG